MTGRILFFIYGRCGGRNCYHDAFSRGLLCGSRADARSGSCIRRIEDVWRLSCVHLRALGEDENGECCHRSSRAAAGRDSGLPKPDPLLTFKLDDVAFVYGTKWKQRYFKRIGDDYFPLPAQWDVNHKIWRPYFVAANTDWWVPLYPADNMKRPTGPLCDGCHSVNYDIKTKTVKQWNVGCERCHGPGSEHARNPSRSNIVNPAKLDFIRANDTCIQCHSQGQPLKNPMEGQYYDWPVGFHQGGNLKDFWKLEEHKFGEMHRGH
jgi:hypothetical protein